MKFDKYLQACLLYAADSQGWSDPPRKHVVTIGDGTYFETCDNAQNGAYVDWAYQLKPEQVRRFAPQEFADCIVDEFQAAIDNEALTQEQLQCIVDKYS